MAVYDCTNESTLREGIEMASDAVREGKVVVIPTDTVYGIGCDAFSPEAVTAVLEAKGRGRDMPPPVLVPSARTVDGLAMAVPAWARDLMEEFWPGALTLVLRSHTSLVWDLGDTNGTVALRMPQDAIALQLLTEVGPMAVTSANRTGSLPATTAMDAATQLGSAVEVYLDGGPREAALASTIVDCTGAEMVVLREGAITRRQLDEVVDRSLAATEAAAAAAAAEATASAKPETGGPEANEAEASEPETGEPEATEPEAPEPQPTELAAPEPQPEPEPTEPEVVEPEVVEPDTNPTAPGDPSPAP